MRSIRASSRRVWALLCCVALVAALGRSAFALDADSEAILRSSAATLREELATLSPSIDALGRSAFHGTQALTRVETALGTSTVPRVAYAEFFEHARDDVKSAEVPADIVSTLERVAIRLDALGDGVPALEDAPSGLANSAHIRGLLTTELERGAYEGGDDLQDAFLTLAWRRFLDWWNDLFSIKALERLQRVSVYFMTALMVATVAALAYFYLRSRNQGGGHGADREEMLLGETRRMAEPGAYALEAQRLAAEGRYREALRAQFLRTLAELEGMQLVTFDRTRTNSEYLRQLRQRVGASELLQTFGGLTRIYNAGWYGHAPCTAEGYAHIETGASRTIALAQATR